MTQEQKDQDQLGMWGSIERLEMRLNTLRARLASMQEHCPWCKQAWVNRAQGDSLGTPIGGKGQEPAEGIGE